MSDKFRNWAWPVEPRPALGFNFKKDGILVKLVINYTLQCLQHVHWCFTEATRQLGQLQSLKEARIDIKNVLSIRLSRCWLLHTLRQYLSNWLYKQINLITSRTAHATVCASGSILMTDGPSGWTQLGASPLAVDSSGVLETSVVSWSPSWGCLCLWWKGCKEKRRWVPFRPPLRLEMWGLSFRIVLFRRTCSCV